MWNKVLNGNLMTIFLLCRQFNYNYSSSSIYTIYGSTLPVCNKYSFYGIWLLERQLKIHRFGNKCWPLATVAYLIRPSCQITLSQPKKNAHANYDIILLSYSRISPCDGPECSLGTDYNIQLNRSAHCTSCWSKHTRSIHFLYILSKYIGVQQEVQEQKHCAPAPHRYGLKRQAKHHQLHAKYGILYSDRKGYSMPRFRKDHRRYYEYVGKCVRKHMISW